MENTRIWTERIPPSGYWLNPTVVRLVQGYDPARILDAGCGNGVLCRQLADCGIEVVGIDGHRIAVEIARERVPEGRFEVGIFSDEPIERNFQIVVSTEVIEHVYDPAEMLTYCNRALQDNGRLIISTPYHGYLKNLVISMIGGWDKHFTTTMLAGHIKFFSRRSLTEMLGNAGFEVERFLGVGRVPYLWKSMILVARKSKSQ